MMGQSKWDADNLHRHTEYAPVKKEPAANLGDIANLGDDSRGTRCPTSQESMN